LDNSAVGEGRGVLREIDRRSGAVARLTSLPPGSGLDDHVHDHPYLSLHLLGAYSEAGDGGEVHIDGPAAAFHPAGAAHADRIGRRGLTTVVVEFEGDWLARALGSRPLPDRSVYWLDGEVTAGAARLARRCLEPAGASASAAAAVGFLAQALAAPAPRSAPSWLRRLDELGERHPEVEPTALGRRLGLSEGWLARAYRAHRGESLSQRRRRRRVETAVNLLAAGALPLAEVALDAGFCDQSHMNRAFRMLLGATPAEVRRERAGHAGAYRPVAEFPRR
jgi:AraC family transcriptional regulator